MRMLVWGKKSSRGVGRGRGGESAQGGGLLHPQGVRNDDSELRDSGFFGHAEAQFHLSLERRARGRTCSRQRFIAWRSRTGHRQVLACAAQNDNKELDDYGLPRPVKGLAMTAEWGYDHWQADVAQGNDDSETSVFWGRKRADFGRAVRWNSGKLNN